LRREEKSRVDGKKGVGQGKREKTSWAAVDMRRAERIRVKLDRSLLVRADSGAKNAKEGGKGSEEKRKKKGRWRWGGE